MANNQHNTCRNVRVELPSHDKNLGEALGVLNRVAEDYLQVHMCMWTNNAIISLTLHEKAVVFWPAIKTLAFKEDRIDGGDKFIAAYDPKEPSKYLALAALLDSAGL